MRYRVEIRDVPRTLFAVARATCSHADVGLALGEAMQRMLDPMRQLDLQPTGAPFCRCTDWRDRDCDIEIGVPVRQPVPKTVELSGIELGGVKAAYTRHVGPYEELAKAHAAIRSWIKENGKASAGSPWETYVTDPREEDDPRRWVTDIYWPIAP
jgi:effector-binding domain-containing protein